MNKSIVFLLMAGVVLAVLHVPDTMVHLAIITGLLLITVKVLWAGLQRFSTPHRDLNY